MPTLFKVKCRWGFVRNDYEVYISGNTLKMISESHKGILETMEDMKSKGCKVELIDDKTILQTIEGGIENDIAQEMRDKLTAQVKAAHFPMKFNFEEVKL